MAMLNLKWLITVVQYYLRQLSNREWNSPSNQITFQNSKICKITCSKQILIETLDLDTE